MTLSDKRLAPLQELIAETAARGPAAIRWTIARKIAVVEAIRVSRLSRDGLCTPNRGSSASRAR